MPAYPEQPSRQMARDVPGSLHALLSNILDYAGLFPPARLPLDEAFHNYLRYRAEPEGWILARFLVPAAQLEQLAVFRDAIQASTPVPLSVLASGGAEGAGVSEALQQDIDRIEACRELHGANINIDAVEMRLPERLAEDGAGDIQAFLAEVLHSFARDATSLPDFFLEVPFSSRLRTVLPRLLDGITSRSTPEDPSLAIKMRTGGLEPSAIPEVREVAYVIASCRDAGVRFKATAGLHHPLRYFDEALNTPMHGFLTLFGAAALAYKHGLGEAEITSLLLEDDPTSIRFDDHRLHWGKWELDTDTIAQARSALAVSFGSCSFDEPRDDLKALGLLPT